MSLTDKQCTPCRGGVEPMGAEQAKGHLAEVPGWELTHEATRIQRDFKLKDFKAALDLVNKVGELAEQENHHPEIAFGYGHVTVEIWTHKINGLHENDFILAAKINSAVDG